MWQVTNRNPQYGAWVAILYFNEGCSNKYAKRGWWHLNPGETATVLLEDISDRAMYYLHAHAPGVGVWGLDLEGTTADCPVQAFDWCDNTSSTNSSEYFFYGVYSLKPNMISYLN
jgi:hypothetical protein